MGHGFDLSRFERWFVAFRSLILNGTIVTALRPCPPTTGNSNGPAVPLTEDGHGRCLPSLRIRPPLAADVTTPAICRYAVAASGDGLRRLPLPRDKLRLTRVVGRSFATWSQTSPLMRPLPVAGA